MVVLMQRSVVWWCSDSAAVPPGATLDSCRSRDMVVLNPRDFQNGEEEVGVDSVQLETVPEPAKGEGSSPNAAVSVASAVGSLCMSDPGEDDYA